MKYRILTRYEGIFNTPFENNEVHKNTPFLAFLAGNATSGGFFHRDWKEQHADLYAALLTNALYLSGKINKFAYKGRMRSIRSGNYHNQKTSNRKSNLLHNHNKYGWVNDANMMHRLIYEVTELDVLKNYVITPQTIGEIMYYIFGMVPRDVEGDYFDNGMPKKYYMEMGNNLYSEFAATEGLKIHYNEYLEYMEDYEGKHGYYPAHLSNHSWFPYTFEEYRSHTKNGLYPLDLT